MRSFVSFFGSIFLFVSFLEGCKTKSKSKKRIPQVKKVAPTDSDLCLGAQLGLYSPISAPQSSKLPYP